MKYLKFIPFMLNAIVESDLFVFLMSLVIAVIMLWALGYLFFVYPTVFYFVVGTAAASYLVKQIWNFIDNTWIRYLAKDL